MSELKATTVYDAYWKANSVGEGTGIQVYLKSEADKVIADLKADYKEACDRLQTANLIKDCPPKKVATEIVKEYDNGLG